MARVVERTRQTARELRVNRVLSPIREFIQTEVSSGILLLTAATIALIWANSPWSSRYVDLWHAQITIGIGEYGLSKSLLHWINDGLMTIFFFVIGLEIKREILGGELATVRRAILPVVAAVGGAALPALVYLALNAGTDDVRGWGVPMATDIAFALGLLALLGSRVPLGLKIFVTALAIVDDLIAVLVIALFYTDRIDWGYGALAALIFVVLMGVNRLGVSRLLIYGLLGFGLWLVFLKSGVHATVAGVLLAITIPSRTRDHAGGETESEWRVNELDGARHRAKAPNGAERQTMPSAFEAGGTYAQSPMQFLEHLLHPWVAFLVIPLFALANAGILLREGPADALGSSVTLGVVAGLVIGKQIGITLFTWLMIRSGVTRLPEGVTLRHIYGASCLAGVGFTMSIFIADLAFRDAERLTDAKVGILMASVLAGVMGWCVLRLVSRRGTTSSDDALAAGQIRSSAGQM